MTNNSAADTLIALISNVDAANKAAIIARDAAWIARDVAWCANHRAAVAVVYAEDAEAAAFAAALEYDAAATKFHDYSLIKLES